MPVLAKNLKYIFLWTLVTSAICLGGTVKDSVLVRSRNGIESVAGIWTEGSASTSPVVVWFHGGMSSGNCQKGLVAGDDLARMLPNFTVVSPSACRQNHWVSADAVDWVDAVLDSVAARRRSPVDTVYLIGVSDGGLGVMTYSLEGRRKVLSRVLISSFGKMLGDAEPLSRRSGFRSGRWLFIQGGADRLYPSREIVPWIETFCKNVGVECDLRYDPKGEHDWSYWKLNHPEWILKFF